MKATERLSTHAEGVLLRDLERIEHHLEKARELLARGAPAGIVVVSLARLHRVSQVAEDFAVEEAIK